MAIELYWGSGSPFAWRAMLALEAKRIPYTPKLIEFSKGEHKAQGFLAMNPRGKVPVMKDDGLVLYEALAILNYLEKKQPEPALLGRTPSESGRIWRAISECLYYLETPAFSIILPIFFGGLAEKAAEIKAATEAVHKELAGLEATLSRQPWLAGDMMSGADLWVYPLLMVLLRAAGNAAAKPLDLGLLPLDARYPALETWRRRVEALPGYERTYPPHWKQAA